MFLASAFLCGLGLSASDQAAAVATAATDRDQFQADPLAYLAQADAARVFRPAPGGPGVPVIAPVVSSLRLPPGASATLAVLAVAGTPVTFASQNGGAFANGLGTITVAADQDGRAEARFTATQGTVSWVDVVAASPGTAGRARIAVQVAP